MALAIKRGCQRIKWFLTSKALGQHLAHSRCHSGINKQIVMITMGFHVQWRKRPCVPFQNRHLELQYITYPRCPGNLWCNHQRHPKGSKFVQFHGKSSVCFSSIIDIFTCFILMSVSLKPWLEMELSRFRVWVLKLAPWLHMSPSPVVYP